MGRLPKNVEFLVQLQEIMGLSASQLSKATGKKKSNITNYLSGKITPKKRVLKSIIEHLSEWNVVTKFEVHIRKENVDKVPATPGIYALYDSAGNTLYVGQATNLRTEIKQTLKRKTNFPIRKGPNGCV